MPGARHLEVACPYCGARCAELEAPSGMSWTTPDFERLVLDPVDRATAAVLPDNPLYESITEDEDEDGPRHLGVCAGGHFLFCDKEYCRCLPWSLRTLQ